MISTKEECSLLLFLYDDMLISSEECNNRITCLFTSIESYNPKEDSNNKKYIDDTSNAIVTYINNTSDAIVDYINTQDEKITRHYDYSDFCSNHFNFFIFMEFLCFLILIDFSSFIILFIYSWQL